MGLPNLPHASVPAGESAEDNPEVRRDGEPRSFDFPVKDHVDVGAALGMDFDAASKISGARFVVMKGELARLHRALAQFMLDMHTREHGYTEVYVPYMVTAECADGVSSLAKFKDDLFKLENRDLYLIPTAEYPGHQPRARRDRGRRGAAAQVRLPLAVLPERGGLLRQGHARHDPPAPVRQGRARADRAPGEVVRRRSRS